MMNALNGLYRKEEDMTITDSKSVEWHFPPRGCQRCQLDIGDLYYLILFALSVPFLVFIILILPFGPISFLGS